MSSGNLIVSVVSFMTFPTNKNPLLNNISERVGCRWHEELSWFLNPPCLCHDYTVLEVIWKVRIVWWPIRRRFLPYCLFLSRAISSCFRLATSSLGVSAWRYFPRSALILATCHACRVLATPEALKNESNRKKIFSKFLQMTGMISVTTRLQFHTSQPLHQAFKIAWPDSQLSTTLEHKRCSLIWETTSDWDIPLTIQGRRRHKFLLEWDRRKFDTIKEVFYFDFNAFLKSMFRKKVDKIQTGVVKNPYIRETIEYLLDADLSIKMFEPACMTTLLDSRLSGKTFRALKILPVLHTRTWSHFPEWQGSAWNLG